MHADQADPAGQQSLFVRLQRLFIEPDNSIEDRNERRQAKLLSALLLVLIPCTLSMAFFSDAPWIRRLAVGIMGGTFIPAYFLSRTARFRPVGIYTVLALAVPPFVNFYYFVIAADPIPWQPAPAMSDAFRWLAIPLVTGGLWLSSRSFLSIAGAILVGLVATLFVLPVYGVANDLAGFRESLIFLVLLSGLIWVAIALRTLYLNQVHSRSQALQEEVEVRTVVQQELEMHKNNLEGLVEERARDLHEALAQVQTLNDRIETELQYTARELKAASEDRYFEDSHIIGLSPRLKEVLSRVQKVSATNLSVLLLGESGTGKGLTAKAIWENSDRSKKPYVTVDCSVLPANLIEDLLFGHEKGAFTGADRRVPGKFEVADGGTLFLDEFGELPLNLQSRLLRVLQDGEFERIGGTDTVKVDVRVIAATNRDIKKAVEDGKFREDLYYRVCQFVIEMPSLNERNEDIPVLARHFAEKYCDELEKPNFIVGPLYIEKLQQHYWKGNIRELQNVIRQSVLETPSDEQKLMFSPEFYSNFRSNQEVQTFGSNGKFPSWEEVQIQYFSEALERAKGKISGLNGAAELTGIKDNTFRSKLQKLKLR